MPSTGQEGASPPAADSVRVVEVEGRVGFWMPRSAASDYLHVVTAVLPRYQEYMRLTVRRDVQVIDPLLAWTALQEAAYRRQAIDLQAMIRLDGDAIRNHEEITRLLERKLRWMRFYKYGAIISAGALAGVFVAR